MIRLKKWFKLISLKNKLSLVLLLNSTIAFSQFNSIVKQENPLPVNLVKRLPVELKPQHLPEETAVKDEEVEDLKKAPKLISSKITENAEALIFSKLGAHLPIDRITLRSSFGYRIHPITKKQAFHTGIDLSARSANIYAVLHGSVSQTGYNSIIGNFVKLEHGNYTTVYGHLSEVFVRQGELVKSGEVIGISGSTGRATGEHLHFTVKYKGYLIHPLIFLNAILRETPTDLYTTLVN
jgi:murein DD-endopeptidase MepM/ murein hydrolase activator NlpD